MGFRQGAWATVWEVRPSKSGKSTNVRISTSYKKYGTYHQDFQGYCTMFGKAHEKASSLKVKDRIRIIQCDETNSYDKETGTTNSLHRIFDFATAGGGDNMESSVSSPPIDDILDETEDAMPY